jgi:ssDNA-binding Zn-finger/Zn-ribbon topoisomerase 1
LKRYKIFIGKDPQYSKCPKCNSQYSLHRSRARNMAEQIVKKTTFYKIYRCRECGWRGYMSTIVLTSESIKAVLVYGFLILFTAYFVRLLIGRFIAN